MSRKTYSLSAAAVVAIASVSFSSADGAEAFAQASPNDVVVAEEATDGNGQDLGVEVMPLANEEITFVSNPVLQPLPSDADGIDTEDKAALPQANVGSLRELVGQVNTGELTEQMRCLAGAVYFESRGEPLAGQLAVAQVVINRSEDARWPASYCGVVYQRAQFSFVKNGAMPRIRTSSNAWERAKSVAKIAHEGLWDSEAGDAVYFHAKYVRPKWSYRKERTAQIDTHVFYR
ncbi:MAG: cell wall hydrolase [Pseudomonadota bacterium]